jgi:hypothetical protein
MNGAMLVASQKLAWSRCLVILMVRKWNGLQYHDGHVILHCHMEAKSGQLEKQITGDYRIRNEIYKNCWLRTQKFNGF